jgi:tetratricopeptide (TPR) repeat protein
MSQDAEDYFRQSEKLASKGEFAESMMLIDKAIGIDPDNFRYYLARGLLRRDLDQYEQAIQDFDKVIQMTSDQEALETAHLKRAVAYEALGNFPATLSNLDWLIENGSGSSTTLCWRGLHRLGSGLIDAAIEDYTRAYQLSNVEEILLQRSHAYFAAKRYEDCIHDLSTILESAAKFSPLWLKIVYHWRGNAYYNMGQYSEALDDFNSVLKIESKPLIADASDYSGLISSTILPGHGSVPQILGWR